MKVVSDRTAFDRMQNELTGKIVAVIHRELRGLTLGPEQKQDLLGRIAFQVTAALDGEPLDLDGAPFYPVVAFTKSDEYDELIAVDESSWMHEYVLGWVEDLGEV
jgi:hypothetical protein